MENIFVLSGIYIFVYMTLCFLFACLIKRNDIADIAWGIGFILIAGLSLFQNFWTERLIIAFILVCIWGIRLALHIFLRNRNKPEDFRYKLWRDTWGKWFYLRSYLQIFILQGVLLFLVIFPIMFLSLQDRGGLHWVNMFGVVIWIIGFLFETGGDYQLKKFIAKAENKGKIMQSGFWSLTRHPNYFGEVTQWWGIWFLTFSLPYAWVALIGPLTITFLILKVSGIPMLEKKYEGNSEFELYKKRTNAFFPWFPKN